MADNEEPAYSREYELRRLEREKDHRAKAGVEQLQRDLADIAATVPGKRLLAYLALKDRQHSFQGNRYDLYLIGRRRVGEELEQLLKAALSRDVFLEIIYPKSKEE